jgi:hypothetical protein
MSFTKVAAYLHQYERDPLGFVMDVFPWGQEGTILYGKTGPDTWQTEVLVTIGKCLDWEEALQIAISSGHGVGKGLGYDVEIPTPFGIRRWGDLQPGDKVFGRDGRPATVLQLHPYGKTPTYRVTFDDGSFCETSGAHLWNVRGRQERRKRVGGWRTLETTELARLGAKRSNGTAEARQWEIPIQGAAEFNARSLKVHPYFMGVWLGDGVRGSPSYGKPYQEVADKLTSFGYVFGKVSVNSTRRALGVAHLFTDDVFRCGSHERYIPNDYKFNTIENRMRLFEGLCDTDGEVHQSGSIGYSSTSERLANDVIWLARSLGCKAQMHPATKIGKYRNEYGEIIECRECWRVNINAPFNPFSIPHKRDAYKPSEHRYLTRWIDSIEEIAPADGMCITVDREDGLYLANDFIVTHNSCLVSWIIFWGMSTRVGTKGVVTANTDNQLRTKTWVEIGKWYQLAPILHGIFVMEGTSIHARDEKWAGQWRFDRITWSEKNTEAFAGLHNKGRRLILIMDEASSIPDLIWEVSEGMKTDGGTEILWLACGNPTRSIGRFKDCFTRNREQWRTKKVDARTSKITNKKLYEGWLRSYGEDSDFFRVRVRGEFPRVGSLQFISDEVARSAAIREPIASIYDPLIMGVDVARFGCFDDRTEILTDDGWKLFCNLHGGEQVLTLNGDVAEWGSIDEIHKYEFDGELNLYESRAANFCITDNHNLLVRSNPKSSDHIFRRYDELPSEFLIKGTNKWHGDPLGRIKFRTVAPMFHGGERIHEFEFDGLDWASFMGWFLSEGNVYIEKRHNPRYRILIAQNPGWKQDIIKDLLTKMGLKYRITPNGKQIEFTNQAIGMYLRSACNHGAANKRIPKEIKNASTVEINAFLEAYRLGDGTCRKDRTGKTYTTSSKEMVDDLQEILAKLGRAGSFKISETAGSTFHIEGRESTRLHDTYVLCERSSPSDRRILKSKATRVSYKGLVWCVSTSLKSIYVRHNGVPMWSGNSNNSVIAFRRGRDARTIPWEKFSGVDTNTLSLRIIELFAKYQPDGVFVDAGGVGGGVADRLRYSRLPVRDVIFGATADGSNHNTEEGMVVYANKRTQMWGAMRDWLGNTPNPFGDMLPGGAIPNDINLIDDLVNVQYGYTLLYGKDAIILEKKEDMRRRGVNSPDEGDALAITFAFPILKSDHTDRLKGKTPHQNDYNPYAEYWGTP